MAPGIAVSERTPMLDHCDDLAPFIETDTSERWDWVNTPAEHSFGRFPATEDHRRIVQAYAARP